MPRGYQKSKYNACPVCGLPRGKGPHEFSHGKCAEKSAADLDAKERTTSSGLPGDLGRLSVASAKKAKDNQNRKVYKSGRLPPWMFS